MVYQMMIPQHYLLTIQSVVGTFLFYTRATYNTILPALDKIAAHQAALASKTNNKIRLLLDDFYTYLDERIRFNASNMILHIESDAAYLVAPKAQSHITGFYDSGRSHTQKLSSINLVNGPVYVKSCLCQM